MVDLKKQLKEAGIPYREVAQAADCSISLVCRQLGGDLRLTDEVRLAIRHCLSETKRAKAREALAALHEVAGDRDPATVAAELVAGGLG